MAKIVKKEKAKQQMEIEEDGGQSLFDQEDGKEKEKEEYEEAAKEAAKDLDIDYGDQQGEEQSP